MKVGIFLATTTLHNEHKLKYMKAFASGVKQSKHEYFLESTEKYVPCDIAVIFGFYGINLGSMQKIRKNIYTKHSQRRKDCIFIDGDLFRFSGDNLEETEENTHLRIAYKSIYFDRAMHFNKNSDSSRWDIIKKRKNIEILDYRKNGEHILISLNSNPHYNRGWSAGSLDIYQWLERKILEIRKYSNRPIIARFHPGAKDEERNRIPFNKFISAAKENIKFSGGIDLNDKFTLKDSTLQDDCQDAWACVSYNTSAAALPLLKGIPCFTDCKSSPIFSVSNNDIRSIEKPILHPREQWFYDTAYCLWNYKEIKEGLYWNRFLKFTKSR